MWRIYLDESGDLGFDFVTKSPTKFFTISILVIEGHENNRNLLKGVKKTIRRKLPKRPNCELKGAHTKLDVKKYFYGLVQSIPFKIYAMTLNKRRVYDYLHSEKPRLYNYLTRQLLDKIPLQDANPRIELVVDKCKNQKEMSDFNQYIVSQLQSKVPPHIPLDINHHVSHESFGLQAADLFCWGLFRGHERNDYSWRDVFAEKVCCDDRFL